MPWKADLKVRLYVRLVYGRLPLERRFNGRAELGGHFGIDPEPERPRDAGLVQEHPEAVDRAVAARSRGGQQRRLERNVDDVAYEGAGGERSKVEVERRLPDHPLARRVDEHRRAVECAMPVVPGNHFHGRTKLARKRVGALTSAIGDANLAGTAIDQAVDDRPGAAAGADDDRRPRVGTPARLPLKDVARKAMDVVVRARQRSVR